jgi:hypothetical protein
MSPTMRAHQPQTKPIVATRDEAARLAGRLIDCMNALLKLVEEETALVRAGKIAEAIKLDARKSELSRDYVAAIGDLKHNRSFFAKTTPELLKTLHQHHDAFRAMLQVNLTVLATAHAVSEGIVRGVNGELQKKNVPQTYTAGGYHSSAGTRHAAPLTVSKTL